MMRRFSLSGVVALLLTSGAVAADENTTFVQGMLNRLGFSVGAADGVWGARTEEAVQAYLDTYRAARALYPEAFPEPNGAKEMSNLYASCILSEERLSELDASISIETHRDRCFSFASARFVEDKGQGLSHMLRMRRTA